MASLFRIRIRIPDVSVFAMSVSMHPKKDPESRRTGSQVFILHQFFRRFMHFVTILKKMDAILAFQMASLTDLTSNPPE